MYMGILNHLWK